MQGFIGVDVGGTTIKFGLFSEQMELVEKWRIPTPLEENGQNVLIRTAESVLQKLSQRHLPLCRLKGLGIGIPGPVVDMRYAHGAVNLHWGKTDVAGLLEPLLHGVPVYAANDANMAALAEATHGAGRGFGIINLVTLGTGLGSGIVMDGHIVEGAHGFGGEYGLAEFGAFGRHGTIGDPCLEAYASGTAVVRMAREMIQAGRKTALAEHNDLSCQMVFSAAEKGDPVALEAIDVLGRNLGCALSWVSRVIDPDAFIIGGGVSAAGPILLEAIRRHYSFVPSRDDLSPQFLLARLGNDAGIYGAAQLAADKAKE